VGARRTPEAAGHPVTLGHSQGDVVEHGHLAKQRVDLEGAPQAALDAGGLGQARDVLAAQEDLTGRGREAASEHVDEGGLAPSVGADERVAHTGLQTEVDAIGHREGAEVLAEPARLQRRGHRAFPTRASTASARPSNPPRAKSTTTTSMSPIPKYQ